MIEKIIGKYSTFVTRHPFIVLILVIVVSAFAIQMAGSIETKKSDVKDMLPQDVEAIRTLNIIEDEFGSTNDVFFVVEIDPAYNGSDEVRDIRDPRAIRYMNQLSELALHTDDVVAITGPAQILKNINNGRLPQSLSEVQVLSNKNGLLDSSISRDYTTALVRIRTTDDVDLKNIETELEKILMQVPEPPGIKASLGGTVMEMQVTDRTIQPDMAKTSLYSLVGILAVILFIFRSVKYGFTPLTTIIFGSLWAMGYVGLIGMGLSPQTSGVLSMIMGIGIDFGIQVVTRYRMELQNKNPADAMSVTLNSVIMPMSTTAIAALIGFQAMSLGKLTFLADMGTMMSYGVVASMAAAITVVPALILIFDTIKIKNLKTNTGGI
ncbi:putative RND superfamily exporter [Candidatus Methanoperedens nitroreducens]|uniref:Putative RND superfamily exporter n=1 Tax=Candidatus Methanoperedens nitratireducens TaxID=1392998 RepID=A0A062VCV3_9EURY|nr:MMPL family transporter [Candidatus Methanoperedens nitroreducens]KCZ73085.1 putative RND superfamily exporter [Candidatus Methanoperedens nitroreducens]MDJ1422969.1 MMPL family transporter [Candidatus Methanoperedens sp.]